MALTHGDAAGDHWKDIGWPHVADMHKLPYAQLWVCARRASNAETYDEFCTRFTIEVQAQLARIAIERGV